MFPDSPSRTAEPPEIYLYDSQNMGSKMQLSGRYYNQDLFLAKSLTHQLTYLQKKVSLSKPLASDLGETYGGEEGVRFNR